MAKTIPMIVTNNSILVKDRDGEGFKPFNLPSLNPLPNIPFYHEYAEKIAESQYYFKEFQQYVHKCYYTSCSHTHEPDCAVKEQLNKDISEIRYCRYVTIYEELEEKERLNSCLPSLKNEIDKVEALLTDAYSINIIPSKFRNIYAAYFLYDFISTSTASLNEALLHCDLDTIQQKFDEVIQQQEAMIMELAYQNALNEKIVRQNEQILGHAIQTENNAALAAQYTKIAANNTGVVAAIQISEYLRP